MKKFTLLLTLCISAWSFAGNFNLGKIQSGNLEKIEPKLKKEIVSPDSKKEKQAVLQLAEKNSEKSFLSELNSKTNLFEPPVTKSVQSSNYHILDSIIVNSYGEKANKIDIRYNSRYNQTEEIYSYWNFNIWIPYEAKKYEYDNKQNPTAYYEINYEQSIAIRMTYEYNDKNQVIEAIAAIGFNDEWDYSQKREYAYDEKGNTTEEHIYVYDNEEWQPFQQVFVEYDNERRQLSFKSYQWDGIEWEGIEYIEQEFYERDILSSFTEYIWDYDLKEFIPFKKFERVYEDGFIVTESNSYWNIEHEDWRGEQNYQGIILRNDLVNYEYDEERRMIYESSSQLINEEWELKVYFTHDYEELESGDTQVISNHYFTDYRGLYFIDFQLFNPEGMWTYRKTTNVLPDGSNEDFEEYEFNYDENSNLIDKKQWEFNNNIKYAKVYEIHQYNEKNEPVMSEYMYGQGTGEDDWIKATKYEYEFENGIQTKSFFYRYDSELEDYRTEIAKGDEYNFRIPLSRLVVSLDYDAEYKLLKSFEYDGDEEGTGWEHTIDRTFYWTEPKPSTEITENKENNTSIYPNPTTGILYIDAQEEVQIGIYNLQGVKLLQSTEKQINISNFATGTYIIDINGTRTKVIKN